MADVQIALAASARDWSDAFHRSLLDHGGGTIIGRVMSADQAIEASFDVIFIDDICSFLTQRLVFELRRAGKSIVGVFSPEDGSDGKRRLLEVGISDVVETGAGPEEFLSIALSTVVHSSDVRPPSPEPATTGMTIGVTGPPGGVGVTEVSIGIASELARRYQVALVDLNQGWPAIGQRLGLRVHPNLRTAVDFALHEPDRLHQAMHIVGNLRVVSGLANPDGGKLPASDIAGLVASMGNLFTHIVLDLGAEGERPSDLLLRRTDVVLVVGKGDPLGIIRVIRAFDAIRGSPSNADLGIVINRVAGSSRQRQEVVNQMADLLPQIPTVLVPEDRRLGPALWEGDTVSRGNFHKQIRRLSRLFESASA
jgi:MinD-like ATPase involved in chromosome partitioning or flagellar assembly